MSHSIMMCIYFFISTIALFSLALSASLPADFESSRFVPLRGEQHKLTQQPLRTTASIGSRQVLQTSQREGEEIADPGAESVEGEVVGEGEDDADVVKDESEMGVGEADAPPEGDTEQDPTTVVAAEEGVEGDAGVEGDPVDEDNIVEGDSSVPEDRTSGEEDGAVVEGADEEKSEGGEVAVVEDDEEGEGEEEVAGGAVADDKVDTEDGDAENAEAGPVDVAGEKEVGEKRNDSEADEKPDAVAVSGQTATKDNDALNGEPATGSNETAAYLGFTMSQMVENDDVNFAFSMTPIFENGKFVGPFVSNPNSSEVGELSSDVDDSRASWYTDGNYADRISFQFTYLPDFPDYAFSEPVIGVSQSPGISPSLESVQNDAKNGVGSFNIIYKCKEGGPEKTYVSLHMQITKKHSFDTMWTKTCGHGRNEQVDFGFVGGDGSLVPFNRDGTYGTEESHRLEVGPLSVSTELSASLRPPAWNLDFERPHLESDSPEVLVSLRNTIAASTMSSDDATKFSVMYECEQNSARANIMFTVAIPPWDNLTASWTKSCGGTQSQALLIGTSGSGSYDIMQDGELNELYNVSEGASIEKAYGKVQEIDGQTRSKRIYLTNGDDASDIHIQTIAFTMTNPDVLATSVEVPFSASSAYLPAGGGTIKRRETKSLSLHFTCKKMGESLVLVTLPTLKYKNVEFGFMKHCLAPQVRHHSGFLLTPGSILSTLLLLAVVGTGGAWFYLRRRGGAKYAPVSTNDRAP